MFRRNYRQERSRDKSSFVRWRGTLWFQIVATIGLFIYGTLAALYITVALKYLWQAILNSMQFFENVSTISASVPIYWDKLWSNFLNALWPKQAFAEFMTLEPTWLYAVGLGLWLYLMWNQVLRRAYDWHNMFSDHANDVNHFASFYEIDSVYELIPDRNKMYPGKPGHPVAHVHGLHWRMLLFHPFLWLKQLGKSILFLNREEWFGWYKDGLRPKLIKRFPKAFENQLSVTGGFTGFYWIDTTPTHDIKTGASRSGKDQTQGYPLIDINSRSLQPWNIIDTDAKNEDFKMSYRALRQRNFDVKAINIDEVSNSESFNPFQLALDYAMDGDLESAKIEVSKIVQIIVSTDKGQENVWDETAKVTMQAIILMLLKLSMENNDASLATPASVVQIINSFTAFRDDTEDGLTKYLNNLDAKAQANEKKPGIYDPLTNEIRLLASSYLGSSGDTKTSVMFTVQAKSKLFASETIARLTSHSTVTPLEMAFPRMIKLQLPKVYGNQPAVVTLYDGDSDAVIEEDKVQTTNSGVLSYPFKATFPDSWYLDITFNESGTSSALRASKIKVNGVRTAVRDLTGAIQLDKYSKRPTYKAKITHIEKSLFDVNTRQMRADVAITVDLKYSEKPQAVFIITPQDNDDYAAIATLYISQVYAVTTSLASKITRRKLTTPILYKLNEFSMFPRIPGFNNLLTRGLTYGHTADIYLQSLSQLNMQYSPDEVQEIRDNSLNWIHILSPNAETNEALSKALGEVEVQTESVNSQMGEDRLNRGNRHINKEKVALLSPLEISQLLPNEQITVRLAKRTDKKGRDVRAFPVFAQGPFKMPNAWKNIGKLFNLNYYTTDLNIRSKTRHLDYSDFFQDFKPYYKQLEDEVAALAAEEANAELEDVQVVNETTNADTTQPDHFQQFLSDLDLNEPMLELVDQNNQTLIDQLVEVTRNVVVKYGLTLTPEANQSLANYNVKTFTKGQYLDTYLQGMQKALFDVENEITVMYDDEDEEQYDSRGRFM